MLLDTTLVFVLNIAGGLLLGGAVIAHYALKGDGIVRRRGAVVPFLLGILALALIALSLLPRVCVIDASVNGQYLHYRLLGSASYPFEKRAVSIAMRGNYAIVNLTSRRYALRRVFYSSGHKSTSGSERAPEIMIIIEPGTVGYTEVDDIDIGGAPSEVRSGSDSVMRVELVSTF